MPGFGSEVVTREKELLVGSRFYFDAPGKVEQRAILEITGLTVECPPANSNAVLGSYEEGRTMRQATPTRQKFSVLSLKLVAEFGNAQLFEWYTECNNESGNQAWQDARTDSRIVVYTQDGRPAGEWSVLMGYPVKYSGPEFKSSDEVMANETIEIVYEDFQKTL